MLHMSDLIKLFDSVLPLSEVDKVMMAQHISVACIKKGVRYCEQGMICKKMGLVVNGVFKVARINPK